MLRQGGGALWWVRIEISSLCGKGVGDRGMGCNELPKTCIVSPKTGDAVEEGDGGGHLILIDR